MLNLCIRTFPNHFSKTSKTSKTAVVGFGVVISLLAGCGGPVWKSDRRNSGSQQVVIEKPSAQQSGTVSTPGQAAVTEPPVVDRATVTSRPFVRGGSSSQTAANQPLAPPDLATPNSGLTPEQYLERARTARPPTRQDLELKAAAAWIERGETGQASRILSAVDMRGLGLEPQFRRQLLYVEIEQSRGAHDRALSVLSALARQRSAPQESNAEILRLQAKSEIALKRYLAAAGSLSQRQPLLGDVSEQTTNAENIWSLLRLADVASISAARTQITDPEFRGWLELAEINGRAAGNPGLLNRAVQDWQQRYAGHPGTVQLNDIIQGASTAAQSDGVTPVYTDESVAGMGAGSVDVSVSNAGSSIRQIALLLPLGSSFGNLARAVHDGFMALHNVNGRPDKPRVVLYDVGSDNSLIGQYYESAVRQGADFVVGPLGRSAVDSLVESGAITTPTLLLGVSQRIASVSGPVFQFGLVPEDEAAAVANHAAAAGHRVAAILTPEGDLGQRMQLAFIDAWRSAGGTVGSAVSYDNSQAGYSSAAKRLLEVDSSRARSQRLGIIIDSPVEFEPRRRKDIDVVLMFATTATGRQLKPQLDFHQGHDLKVYATSQIYNGQPDPVNDADLDGIVFPDMPWIVSPDPAIVSLRQRFAGQGASGNARINRLFGFGMDAYSLVPNLGALASNPRARFDGVTARLGIDASQRVSRQLSWVQFTNGTPRALGPGN